MKIKRCFSFFMAFIMTLSCFITSSFSIFAATPDYGVVKEAANSTFLYFGWDSITGGQKGELGEGNFNNIKFLKTDNLQVKDGTAQLTLPSIDLNGKGYNKVDLILDCASNVTFTSIVLKAGNVEIASFADSDIKKASWGTFSTNTVDLKTTAASGNLTININTNKYAGNYGYIKIYKDGTNDQPIAPGNTSKPDTPVDPGTDVPAYKNKNLSFEERTADLVSRMTLKEKVSQMGYSAPAITRLELGKYKYWSEALHGVGRQGKATSFPSSLSMSNTWDTDLVKRAADITSTEARAKTGIGDNRFNLSYWSPTINMARDPRWGRNEECYGEDPFLTAQIGINFVEGMQGSDEKYLKTISTIKHFVANNCEGERRTGSSVMDEQTLRDYYTRAFQDITEKANPGSVMSSYNASTIIKNGQTAKTTLKGTKGDLKGFEERETDFDYIPSTANYYALTELLRKNWGFNGYVVGDCGAVSLLNSTRTYKKTLFPNAENLADSVIPQSATVPFGINAGNDLDCGSGGDGYQSSAEAAVTNGYISEDAIDIAVYRCLLMRMKTGEFDDDASYRNLMANTALLETDEHVAVAEEAAEKSWVLLKNDDNFLPIDTTVSDSSVTTESAVTTTTESTDSKLGDVNNDNAVDVNDASELLQFVLDKANVNITIDDDFYKRSDVIGNGVITATQVSHILKYVSEGGNYTFPAERNNNADSAEIALASDDNSSNNTKKIAVVGALANQTYLGGYSGEPEKTVSPIEGLRNFVNEKLEGKNVEVDYLGEIPSDAKLFNLKSLKLLDKDKNVKFTVDLSKAEVENCTKDGSVINAVTPSSKIVVKGVNFKDVENIEAEIEKPDDYYASSYGNMVLNYNSGNQPVGSVAFENETATISGKYTGGSGGYNGTADLYININMSSKFHMEAYRPELDSADVIIAYGGTTLDDSDESRDRKSIDLPASQAHITDIVSDYADKTVVVLQAAGQINVKPFENAKAILWNCYNGQTQGTALAKILFGEVNPSGKLTTTWYNPDDLILSTWDKNNKVGEGKLALNGVHKKEMHKDGAGNVELDWIRNDYTIRQRDTVPAGFPEEFSNSSPGRTYQYYNGNAIYPFGFGLSYTNFEISNVAVDKNSASPNDKITVSATVTNTGKVSGAEVVQVYAKAPGGDGVNLPLKQLKGFERTNELAPGESQNVNIEINLKDLHFFSEESSSVYVPEGTWTFMVGGDSKAAEENTDTVNITGTIDKEIKTVSVVPSGIELIGTIDTKGERVNTIKSINPDVSVVMLDETTTDSSVEISYSSNNTDVAFVDENGIVHPNIKEGVALITVTASLNGAEKTTSFPVITVLKSYISQEERDTFKSKLDTKYQSFNQSEYSEANWKIITDAYNEAVYTVQNELDINVLTSAVDSAIAKMDSVKKVPTVEADKLYEITSVTDTTFDEIEIVVKNNTDLYEPSAIIVTNVVDDSSNILRTSDTPIGDSGTYVIKGPFENNENIQIQIWDSSKSKAYSAITTHKYVTQEKPEFMVYNFSDSEFAGYTVSEGEPLPNVKGLSGYGQWGLDNASVKEYTYTKKDGTQEKIAFTKTLHHFGSPQNKNHTSRCLYLRPYNSFSKCKVTVLLEGPLNKDGSGRSLSVYQINDSNEEIELAKGLTQGSGTIVPIEVSEDKIDITRPVYIWGGGSNKYIYGIIVEYTK